MFWTEEKLEKLKNLWENSFLTCEDIGKILGCNKNVIIGKCRRMKLGKKGFPQISINKSYEKKPKMPKTLTVPRSAVKIFPKEKTEDFIAKWKDHNFLISSMCGYFGFHHDSIKRIAKSLGLGEKANKFNIIKDPKERKSRKGLYSKLVTDILPAYDRYVPKNKFYDIGKCMCGNDAFGKHRDIGICFQCCYSVKKAA